MGALSPSTESIKSSRGGRLSILAAMCIAGSLSLLPGSAMATQGADHAATKQAAQKTTTLASQDPETTSSIEIGRTEDVACDRSRKRLWVEGEGWIVRRVTTCY